MDSTDPAELVSDLLEDAVAKLPSKKAEIRILPARSLDMHHDVVLVSDHAPLYIGTIAPKHSVWRVIKTAPNVGRAMRTQLHWHMPTKEECAVRMAEVMRPYWKPIINRHGLEESDIDIDPKAMVSTSPVAISYYRQRIADIDAELDRLYRIVDNDHSGQPDARIKGEIIDLVNERRVISRRLGESAEEPIDAKQFVATAFGPLRTLKDLQKYDNEQAFWCNDPVLMKDYDLTEPFKIWDVHWLGGGVISGQFYHPDYSYPRSAICPITNIRPVIMESTKAEIDAEAEKAEAPASDEQAEAGNYKKGHVSVQGLEIAIENAKGSTRSGVNKAGEAWKVTMPAHYGYIKGTVGKDKDHLDVYIGDNPGGMLVFVVNQKKEEGGFDEHKIMLGFSSKDEAVAAYDKAFTGDLGPKLRESVVSTTMDALKQWLKSGNTKKPFESVAESIVDSLLEDDPKEFVQQNVPPQPRFYGDLKPGMVVYHEETGTYSRVEKIDQTYAMLNYQDENGKLVYDSGPGRVVRLTQFSPSYAYGRFKQPESYNVKAALLATEVVDVDNSDEALWALVDAEIDKYHGPGTAARGREAHLARQAARTPEQVDADRRYNEMMGRDNDA